MKYGNRSVNLDSNAAVLQGNARGTDLSVSATAAQTAVLPGGLYDIWCTVDVYIKIAAVANDVTTATGYLLRANTATNDNKLRTLLTDDIYKIGAIAGGAGTLSFHLVH